MTESFISDERKQKIKTVISNRTTTVVPVLDRIHDLGNINAVIRSSDALGFQELHIIESDSFKRANRVTQGADKWIDVYCWQKPELCIHELKEQGYTICTTDIENGQPLDLLDFTNKTAIIFGNEKDGVSADIKRISDCSCMIPMVGFAQSFNISVAAALSLYQIRQNRMKNLGFHGDLNDQEQLYLQAVFFLKSLNQHERILKNLINRK